MTALERSALLTDAARMKALFQRRLPGFAQGTLIVDDCRILHTRYRTSEEHERRGKAYLSVAYELDVRNAATSDRGVQLLHAKAYPERRARTLERIRDASCVPPRFGDAVVPLDDLNVVVWAFPNDPKLQHLPEVMDPARVHRHLPYSMLPARFDSADDIAEIDIDIVRYKPEVRCTTRFRLWNRSVGLQALTIYGKTFGHARGEEIARRIESVWRAHADDPQAFIVPRPLGYSAAVKTVWQTGLSGSSLVDLIDARNRERYLRDAARGLASLHRLELTGLPLTTLSDRLDAVRAESGEIAQAFPRLRSRLTTAVTTLEADALRLEPCRVGLIHGDFLLKQLVVHDDRLGVFDFDNFSIGDSIQDLGNFIVDLGYHAFEPALVDEMARTFVRAYREAADWHVPIDRVNWHARAQRLRDAYYFHKRKHWTAGFEQELERIIDPSARSSVDLHV